MGRRGNHDGASPDFGKGWGGWPGLATGILTLGGLSLVTLTGPVPPQAQQGQGICDRTPAVRDAIVNAIAGIADCADVSVIHLNGITETLDLSSRNLSNLNEEDFDDLFNVEQLNLNDSSLSSLTENIFADLSNLTVLILANNSLDCLPRSFP